MALLGDAAMVLFYDFEGDVADHDAWHSVEHFHERLSVPGFLRATRYRALEGGPATLVLYEVTGVDVATSPAYLDRLGAPTDWTRAVMPRFRGMVRGFATIAASAGFGLGQAARAIAFTPREGADPGADLDRIAAHPGMAGCYLLSPAPPPPMTAEQALRGADRPLAWLMLLTAWDSAALERAPTELPGTDPAPYGGTYRLTLTATAEDAARTPPPARR